jgi:hypothetical protein
MGVNVNWPNPVTELVAAYFVGQTNSRKRYRGAISRSGDGIVPGLTFPLKSNYLSHHGRIFS